MTVRTPCGGGIRGGQTHSQSPEALFAHVAGLKVVMPSNPYDAKGLLIAAIESDDPVIYFEPKRIYNGPFDGDPHKPAVPWSTHPKGDVPDGHFTVPIGKSEIVRPGNDLTIVTYGTMVHVSDAAARGLGLDAEIIDVRTMVPLDVDTIVKSVKKTGRLVLVDQAPRHASAAVVIAGEVAEHGFKYLKAPVKMVTALDTSVPYSETMERYVLPSEEKIVAAVKSVMAMQTAAV